MSPAEQHSNYKEDARGNLVPISKISERDLLCDEIVRDIVADARLQAEELRHFKMKAMGDVETFVALSSEKYGHEIGGIKGNVTLRSFDGKYKIQRTMADQLLFDERLMIAKNLIGNCIKRWEQGANDNLRAIVNQAFEVDREGKVNTARVLALRRLEIKDQEWQQAMQAISDSIEVADTKPYLRIYERQADGSYQRVSLDIAGA